MASHEPVAAEQSDPSLLRTRALVAAIAVSLFCSPAFAQGAAPPGGEPPHAAAPTDEALAKAVSAALDADPDHFFRHVHVRVDKGVAKLSGYVANSSAIYRARTIASKVPGVTSVETAHLQIDTQMRR
ncbi:MAG: BON domain-containing protein [Gammaproteobacteria bacterium]|nr:BON domain-containing protein [Gammaproteobacteria bacterium]MBV8403225.1 BON domain-containing protein [Gammaproteobacteria bacterium]